MWIYAKIAEEKINAAMARGEFDNLPGTGQPIEPGYFQRSRGADGIATHILQNSGFLPPLLFYRKELELLIAAGRRRLLQKISRLQDQRAQLRNLLSDDPVAALGEMLQAGAADGIVLQRFCQQFRPVRRSGARRVNRVDILAYNAMYAGVCRWLEATAAEIDALAARADEAQIQYEIHRRCRLSMPPLQAELAPEFLRRALAFELLPIPLVESQ